MLVLTLAGQVDGDRMMKSCSVGNSIQEEERKESIAGQFETPRIAIWALDG